jgi:hypothetical protein
MKPRTKLILAGAIALIVGFGVATPLLLLNLTPVRSGPRLDVEVDIGYAYFGVQQFNQNLTGLWINSSDPQVHLPTGDLAAGDRHFIAYLFVANITNLSDKFYIAMDEVYFVAAESIHVDPDGGWGETNAIVFHEVHELRNRYFFNNQVEPGHSRLIALTGIVEAYDVAYSQLQSGTTELFTIIYGEPVAGENAVWSESYCLKQVQLQTFGTEFLYNRLLSENQELVISMNGIDAFIGTTS